MRHGQQQLNGRQYVQTNIGRVYKVGLKQMIPTGWRKLTINEGRQVQGQLKQILSQWSIVAFQTGKIAGSGYGYDIAERYGSQCGQVFIIFNAQNKFNSYQNSSSSSNYWDIPSDAKAQQYRNSEIQNFQKVVTPLGLVLKIGFNDRIPDGFRKMTLSEGYQAKQYLNQILSKWSIVAFQHGKIDGYGYDSKINEDSQQGCGQQFVISENNY